MPSLLDPSLDEATASVARSRGRRADTGLLVDLGLGLLEVT